MIISPSIASANPLRLGDEVRRISQEGYSDLHIDIEDGNFIPNITFGMKTIMALRQITTLPFSFHLMVTRPQDYIQDIAALNPSIIFAHAEALDYPLEFLASLHKHGIKAGLAFNPKSSLEPFSYALQHFEAVLIMTSEPDGKGQEFIPAMVAKAMIAKSIQPAIDVWVDGGVKKETVDFLSVTGVTHAVMGREIFGE